MGKENQDKRAKSQDSIPLNLYKGIMHSLQRFEFIKGDDETLIFLDHDFDDEKHLPRNMPLPELINWIVDLHEKENFERGKWAARAEIQTALGLRNVHHLKSNV